MEADVEAHLFDELFFIHRLHRLNMKGEAVEAGAGMHSLNELLFFSIRRLRRFPQIFGIFLKDYFCFSSMKMKR
jgi:hypothetical protein